MKRITRFIVAAVILAASSVTASAQGQGITVNITRPGWAAITWPNGDRYEGEWHDGKWNGRGIYIFANGHRLEGEFRDNRFIGGSSAGPILSANVPLRSKGGTFVAPVRINNALTLNFAVDSGAADVRIPADVVMTLIRLGTIKNSDFLGKQNYQLADGSIVRSTRFRIHTLEVGGHVVENVTGSIAGVRGSLLLGQSFLSRFKSWKIDNERHELVLE